MSFAARLATALAAMAFLVAAPAARGQDLAHQGTRLAEERLVLRTELGDMVFALYPDVAPETCAHIGSLVRLGVYDSAHFYRIEPNFVAQLANAEDRVFPLAGDQLHAVKRRLPVELSTTVKHLRGTLSMAREDNDPNSATTSFSILFNDSPHLDGKYTVFGGIESGTDVLDAIAAVDRNVRNAPTRKLVVWRALMAENARISALGLRTTIDPEAAKRFKAPTAPVTEVFVAIVVAMSVAGLLVFLLTGRASPKTTAAIGLLVVLLGAFYLLTVARPAIAVTDSGSLMAVAVFAALFALLRLRAHFEARASEGTRPTAPRPAAAAAPLPSPAPVAVPESVTAPAPAAPAPTAAPEAAPVAVAAVALPPDLLKLLLDVRPVLDELARARAASSAAPAPPQQPQ